MANCGIQLDDGTAIGVLMPVMPLFAQKIGITTAELGAAVSVMEFQGYYSIFRQMGS